MYRLYLIFTFNNQKTRLLDTSNFYKIIQFFNLKLNLISINDDYY